LRLEELLVARGPRHQSSDQTSVPAYTSVSAPTVFCSASRVTPVTNGSAPGGYQRIYVPTRSNPTSSEVTPEVGSAVKVEVATVMGDGEFGSSFVFAAVIVVAVPAVETWFSTKRKPCAVVPAVFPIRKPLT